MHNIVVHVHKNVTIKLQAAINAHYTTIVIFFWGVSKQEVLALG
jgi:hypothetical protein